MHDFNVTLKDGRYFRVEAQERQPNPFADGTPKVEVPKTRASKGDPASRFDAVDSFDVVAACLFSATGKWEFRYGRTATL